MSTTQRQDIETIKDLFDSIEDNISQVSAGKAYVNTEDRENFILLSEILKEIKKTNLHLSLMNDVMIKNSEV